ncbi:MAG: histidine phosphatase family protein [Hyphomonadaceae bacterium]|jgi:probable phosphoglycerate mutase|nr:histidine phosphatase family protein [Hyphomonadaceae bacterium]
MLAPGVTVYFVRHGETDWNATQRYQGRRNIPLNATGRAQARRNGLVLSELLGSEASAFDYVASPLLRARETMQIIRRALSLQPDDYRQDPRLSEIDYGHWEGQLLHDLPTTDPEGFSARRADTWNWQPANGESYRMLSERVAPWLKEIRQDSVVASHGGVSRVLRGLVLQLADVDIPFLEVPQDKVLVLSAGSARWL